jgi:mitochondrial fission protein ELM1
MVNNLNDKVVVVFTDRTPDMVKEKLTNKIETAIKNHAESVSIWDSTKESSAIDKINTYENIIHNATRVILTADLDYACAHALSKRYKIYI